MKTKEFIEKVKSLGYEVDIRHGEIRISWYGKECVCIDLEHQFGIYIYWRNLGNNAHRLFVLCMEYARMPIEAREEKKYYLRKKHKAFYEYSEYLNRHAGISSYCLNTKYDSAIWKAQFTQEEIDDIKKKFNTDLEEFAQIEVDSDEV